MPPAVALALEPRVERVISLDLVDVVAQMPTSLVRPLQDGDGSRRVLLKAVEIEKGMATGRPTVSIASVYEQIPEIFLNSVPPSDTREVPLPFAKVLEQFSKLELRNDQYRDQNVPQVETPFLQVTLEDNSRFGIPIGPIQSSVLPPVRIEAATAENIAAAEPDAITHSRFSLGPRPPVTPVSLHDPSSHKSKGNPVIPPSHVAKPVIPQSHSASAPARIPFKLSPNGTDVPATERVPASSGPSVPTSPPASSTPTRIPFNPSASTDDEGPAEPWLTKESFVDDGVTLPEANTPSDVVVEKKEEPPKPEIKISLPLKPILENLPPFQLTGDIEKVPDDARIELSFSLVEPQLVTGRVALKPEEFAAALPEEHRGLFSAKEIAAPVALPLQDVLKNLPDTSLQIRGDQEAEEESGNFATPFSAKAEEDAKRFFGSAAAAGPVAKAEAAKPSLEVEAAPAEPIKLETPATVPAAVSNEPTVSEATTAPKATVTPATGGRTALQELLKTDEEVDAKAVASHIGGLPGVKGCAIMFADGLSLAGSFPPEYGADGLCALAPSIMQRVEKHLIETKLGALRTLTLSCAEAAITFLTRDNLCIAVLHPHDKLAADVRKRLPRILEELSLKYTHPI